MSGKADKIFEEGEGGPASDVFDQGSVGLGPVPDEAQAARDPQPDVGGKVNTPDTSTSVENASSGDKSKGRRRKKDSFVPPSPVLSSRTLLEQEAGRKALKRRRGA